MEGDDPIDEILGSSLRGRIAKGFGAQGIGQVVQIVIRVAEVPILLSFWGAQLYGEWLILSAIPAYLSIGDGGFASAASREMTMRSGAEDQDGALGVFQSTWVLLILLSAVVFLTAVGIMEFLPIRRWFDLSVIGQRELRVVLLALVVHVLIGFQGGLLYGGFWVEGKYPAAMILSAATQFLQFAGLAAAVALGGGAAEAALGYLSGKAVGTTLLWIGQRRASPWLYHGFSNASVEEIRELSGPAFASLAFPLGNALNVQGMRIVVGLVLGPPAVALFSPLRTLSRFAMQPRQVINQLIEPELALAYGSDDGPLFRRLFSRSSQVSLWGTLAVASAVGLGAKWIFPIWTGGELTLDWPTYLLLLGAVIVSSVWYTALMVPYATNRHERIAVWYALVYGAAAFGLGYLGSRASGLPGAALSLILVEVAMTWVVVRASLKMSDVKLADWVGQVLRPPLDLVLQASRLLMRKMSPVSQR